MVRSSQMLQEEDGEELSSLTTLILTLFPLTDVFLETFSRSRQKPIARLTPILISYPFSVQMYQQISSFSPVSKHQQRTLKHRGLTTLPNSSFSG
jgi:hypothetical protein